jgi:hypothetical protein
MIKRFWKNDSGRIYRPGIASPAYFIHTGFKKFIMKKRKQQIGKICSKVAITFY